MGRAVVWAAALLGFCLAIEPASAEIQRKEVAYTDGEVDLTGYLAWDASIAGQRPGVLVVHEWWGLNDYVRDRADQLARLGYVAFALDMYGTGKVTEHPDRAGAWMKAVQANVQAWRERALAGLHVLQEQTLVAGDQIAAIGYCFGGATVLQLAYAGAPVNGVVSFHGALPVPETARAPASAPKILVAHGNADPFVQESQVKRFRAAMEAGGFDWHMVLYAGAKHAFTNRNAGQYGLDALQYNRLADERSWRHMQLFFKELFRTPR